MTKSAFSATVAGLIGRRLPTLGSLRRSPTRLTKASAAGATQTTVAPSLGDPVLARSLGGLFLAAPIVGVVSLVFMPARYGNRWALAIPILAAAALALAVRGRWVTRSGRWCPDCLVASGTLVVTLAVYFAGAPGNGFRVFYVWLVPVAYAVLPTRRAIVHTLLMLGGSGAALVLQVEIHPGLGPYSHYLQMLLVSSATIVAVGFLVQHLSRSVRATETSFADAWRYSPAGLAVISMEGRFIAVNPALAKILGRRSEEMIGLHMNDMSHPNDILLLQSKVDELAGGSAAVTFEKRCIRSDNATIWSEMTLAAAEHGREPVILAFVNDLTATQEARRALVYQERTDPLTELPNRAGLIDELDAALGQSEPIAVIVLDLDRFKVINEARGHVVGDDILRTVANRIRHAANRSDLVTRQGGDEFIVLCRGVRDDADVLDRADCIAEAIRRPIVLASGRHVFTASIGIVHPVIGDDAMSVLRDADVAMYRAKGLGRSRIELFRAEWTREHVAQMDLEHDLARAVATNEIIPYYQPLHDAHDGSLIGFEALARWNHPTRGMLLPAVFIQAAEETGLIVDIGEQILSEATSALAHWRAVTGRPLTVAVNVSPRQLAHPGLVRAVERTIADAGLTTRDLVLEITESALIDVFADPAPLLVALRSAGASIVLDDFGTGYSSLSSLCRFPLDALKIDRSFVANLPQDNVAAAVVAAVVGMAGSLGVTVTAEGVEQARQLDALRRLGCDHVQGYLYGRPMPADAVEHYIAANPPDAKLFELSRIPVASSTHGDPK